MAEPTPFLPKNIALTERPSCNLCGADGGRLSKIRTVFLNIPPEFSVVQCQCCGLVYLSPRPTQAYYKKFYNDQSFYGPHEYMSRKQNLRDFYVARLTELESFLTGRRKLFEIGCASGYFLSVAQERGWQVSGADLSTSLVEFGRRTFGVHLYQCDDFKELELQEENFDCIYASHVLEHLQDPFGALQKIHRLLQKRGVTLIEVPYQFGSLMDLTRILRIKLSGKLGEGRLYRSPSYELSIHHLYFFSPETLRIMLEKAGFSIVKITTYTRKHDAAMKKNGMKILKNSLYRTVFRIGGAISRGPVIEAWAVK